MDTNHNNEKPEVTAVIIGRNEEEYIAMAIKSVLKVGTRLGGVEVIFVDSASTDQSIEVAAEFPIRILQLKPDWPLCVAAGRYTGVRHAKGKHILFLDGDSEVGEQWLVEATEFLNANPLYGGVAGVLNERYVDESGECIGGKENVRDQDLTVYKTEKKSLGGIALFRSEAIDQVGSVNPHLPTAEDHELCLRLRVRGFKLATIPGVMATKYTEDRNTLHEIMRRSRTRMYDYGAVVRYCAGYGQAWRFCRDAIPYVVSFAATVAFLLVSTPIAFYFGLIWVQAALLVLLAMAVVIKKGSVQRACLSVAKRGVSTGRTIASWISTRPKPIESYPTDVIVRR
ncbi:glycosyltransferase [Rubripirellula sp.]|nr:glycosyltransferase [Rubripirellula sp.]MDB4634321.1 glycosyltransferase [Rubripirellula sp.]MDB4654487.1 glycosyltransferase [Rubripirellula sp.]